MNKLIVSCLLVSSTLGAMNPRNSTTVDIAGLDKKAVVCALYESSKNSVSIHGSFGGFEEEEPEPQPTKERLSDADVARYFEELKTHTVNEFEGKVMSVTFLSEDHIGVGYYDMINGAGAAEEAIAKLRK